MSVPLSAGDPTPAPPSSDPLSYAVFTSPFPLRANVAGASGASLTTTLSILVSNNTTSTAAPNLINIYVPTGQPGGTYPLPTFPDAVWAPIAPTAAAATLGVSQPSTSTWQFDQYSQSDTGWVQFQASGPALLAGDSFELQLQNLVVTTQPGEVELCIQSQYVNTLFPQIQSIFVAQPAFYFSGLTALGANGGPACQVGPGDTVTLSWDCSVTDLSAYTLVQSSSSADAPQSTPSQQSLTITQLGTCSSGNLHSDTVFALYVQDGAVLRCSSIRVGVERPNLWAGTLSVSGLMQVNACACDTLALQSQPLGTVTAVAGAFTDASATTSFAARAATFTSATASSVGTDGIAVSGNAAPFLTLGAEPTILQGGMAHRTNTDGFAVFAYWWGDTPPLNIHFFPSNSFNWCFTETSSVGNKQITKCFPVPSGSDIANFVIDSPPTYSFDGKTYTNYGAITGTLFHYYEIGPAGSTISAVSVVKVYRDVGQENS